MCVPLAYVGVTFRNSRKRWRVYSAATLPCFLHLFLSYSPRKAMENTYAKTVQEVLEYFEVDPEVGLSASQVDEQRRRNGWNGKSLASTLLFPAYLCLCKHSLFFLPAPNVRFPRGVGTKRVTSRRW